MPHRIKTHRDYVDLLEMEVKDFLSYYEFHPELLGKGKVYMTYLRLKAILESKPKAKVLNKDDSQSFDGTNPEDNNLEEGNTP